MLGGSTIAALSVICLLSHLQSCADNVPTLNCVPITCSILGLQGGSSAQVEILSYLDERYLHVSVTSIFLCYCTFGKCTTGQFAIVAIAVYYGAFTLARRNIMCKLLRGLRQLLVFHRKGTTDSHLPLLHPCVL